MDALLTRSARQAVEAAALGGNRRVLGLLLGHRRGGRFIIERALAVGQGAFPSEERYLQLLEILDGDVVGFFSTLPRPVVRGKKPPPFSVGKVYLAVKAGQSGCRFSAFFIDHDRRFIWRPIELAKPVGRKP